MVSLEARFRYAHFLLLKIKKQNNPEMDLIVLQNFLFINILEFERKIKFLRRLKPFYSVSKERKEKNIFTRRLLIYICKCFGDSLAHLHLDKYALKQTYYSTERDSRQQDSGFLGGKKGTDAEWKKLEIAIQKGIAAVLTDLTNVIRFGDLALMGGGDPYLIEVKQGKKLNDRGRRQQRRLRKLMNFLEADEAENFRGHARIQRRANLNAEENYNTMANSCISESRKNGFSIVQPEEGLVYAALQRGTELDSNLFRIFEQMQKPWVFDLNYAKNASDWRYYYPFLLSIKNPDDLWDFLNDRIGLTVIWDMEICTSICRSIGFEVSLTDDEYFPVSIYDNDASHPFKIGSSLLQRIGMEFLSPRWLIQAAISNWNAP
ncbi:hypothetical protein ACTOV4_02760 [Brucella sp. C7-11G]